MKDVQPKAERDLAVELFMKQADYLAGAKKLYLEQIEATERSFLISVGAIMVFLCTDAVSSVESAVYPLLWLIPSFVCVYAGLRIDSVSKALIDIANFEIKYVEPLLGSKFPKWETHLTVDPTLGGRATVRKSLRNRFWDLLAAVNFLVAIGQLIAGPIFRSAL
jgi:hypothetical protein